MNKVIWIIAKNGYKEMIREKVVYGILAAGLLVTGSSFFLATVSLEQNHRVLENVGLASIHLFAFFINVFLTTTSMNKDFERRTLYLLFSKPISRSHYVLGKFASLCMLLITTLVILGGLFGIGAYFIDKSILLPLITSLGYSFLEISLLTAIALLLSSFTASLNASLYSVALFIIGHSLPALKDYADRLGGEVLQKLITACYYILPNLEKFDIRPALLYGISIPSGQVWATLGYWLVYTTLVLLLTISIMSQREV